MLRRLLIVLAVIIIIPLVYVGYLISPTSLSGEPIRFVVNLDESQDSVLDRLMSDGYIRKKGVFNLLASFIRFSGKIEPGSYMLSRRMTTYGVARTLLTNPYQKWIILVPGLRKEQVAERLAKKFNWNQTKLDEFNKAADEGYLYPDTYLLNVDYSGTDMAKRLIANFNEKFDAKIQQDLLDQDVRNDTAVKIASLIERESGGDEDKALIAGIIWNRLNKGMALQLDAEIQYAIGSSADWWPMVQPKDLKVDSPYNSYLHKGLPPTPICSPSIESIKAVAYPAETDCFFYLHDHNKQIHCAKTYEEHLKNIDLYLN